MLASKTFVSICVQLSG
uniref:Uncharacterized protein n=1 Tax=Arundo donax TaxID=35708 RepID=A0A0A8ZFX5_ARUDO